MSMPLNLRCNAPGCTYKHEVPKNRRRMVEYVISSRGSVNLLCPECGKFAVTVYGGIKRKKGGR